MFCISQACVSPLVHQAYALTEENILQFKEAWMHLDPRGTQYIPANLLLPLLRAVQYPLGILGARTLWRPHRTSDCATCNPLPHP